MPQECRGIEDRPPRPFSCPCDKHRIDHRNVRLRSDAYGWINDLKGSARFLHFEMGLVFPGQVYISDSFLSERGCGSSPESRTGTWRYNCSTNFLASSSEPPFQGPLGERAPPQAATKLSLPLPDVLGFGVIMEIPGLTKSGQSRICFGFPLRTTNTIVRSPAGNDWESVPPSLDRSNRACESHRYPTTGQE